MLEMEEISFTFGKSSSFDPGSLGTSSATDFAARSMG